MRARALLVVTSIPSVGKRQHDGASTRSPLISTMHVRQFPSARIPAFQQSRGISTPSCSAVSRIDSSRRPVTVLPFSVNVTVAVSWRRISCMRCISTQSEPDDDPEHECSAAEIHCLAEESSLKATCLADAELVAPFDVERNALDGYA